MAKRGQLTPRQAAFVQEYLIDLNASAAAVRAGYSPNDPDVQGYALKQVPQIAAAIQVGQDARAVRTGITQDRVLAELAKIGFANMGDFLSINEDGSAALNFAEKSDDQTAAISEFTVDEYVDRSEGTPRVVKSMKVKLIDKHAALVNMGKHLGMFKERLDVTGGINITISNVDADL